MEIILIAAMASNKVIGVNNTIPWHIPEELKHFKAATMGYPVIMGRKTYDSIGRPLPGRTNIVISNNNSLTIAGCTVTHSIDDALTFCKEQEKVFILGGAEIFRQTLPIADTIILTVLKREVSGDTYFPSFSKDLFIETEEKSFNQTEPYTIHTYRRKI